MHQPSVAGVTQRSVWRARAFLLDTAAAVRARGRTRLPTIAALARKSGCATRTISAALRLLRQDGYLQARQRSGIHITPLVAPREASPPIAASSPAARRARWERLAEAIRAGVLQGDFPAAQALPTAKELAHRHGAGYCTVTKALEALCSAGMLERHGRGYRSPPLPRASRRAAIVFVSKHENIAEIQSATPSALAFWRAAEDACERSNVDMHWVAAGSLTAAKRRGSVVERQNNTVLGHIIWSNGFSEAELETLLQRLLSDGRPVSVLDEGRSVGSRIQSARNLLCQVVSVGATPLSGEAVGRFLLGLGHRRITCLQISTTAQFCINRCRGVCNAFCTAGLPQAVNVMSVPDFEFEQFDREVNEQLQQVHTLLLAYEQRLSGQSARIMPRHLPDLRLWLWGHHMRARLKPLFEAALADRATTAWVLVNDASAFAALDYLHTRRVRVPQELSLVSFDDSLESFGQRLSSYNFNMPAVVAAMFTHILHPPRGRRQQGPLPLEIAGRIMARDSTAPPRGY